MIKRIKLLFAGLFLALGFFFCFCVVSVNAETIEQPVDEQQEVVNETEQPKEEEENQEELNEEIKTAFDWFKSLDAEAVKGWLVGLASYLGANILVVLALAIKLILGKTKEYKQTELWNQVIAKMDAEHQEKVENLIKDFNEKMENLQNELKEEMAKLDDEKKKVAQNNIAILKDNLNDIKVDLEK